jgi:DNA-damage-inducible protein J
MATPKIGKGQQHTAIPSPAWSDLMNAACILLCNTYVLHFTHMWRQQTMPKDAHINARVDKQVKAKAQKVLAKVGLSTTDAINLLLHQIVLRDGLPFEARVPNRETQAAIAQARRGGGKRYTGSTSSALQEVAKSDD